MKIETGADMGKIGAFLLLGLLAGPARAEGDLIAGPAASPAATSPASEPTEHAGHAEHAEHAEHAGSAENAAPSSGGTAAGEAETAEPDGEYIGFTPPLVTSLRGQGRQLRVDVQILVDGEATIKRIQTYMPALRNNLLMFYTGRDPDTLLLVEEREKLRQGTLQEIRKTMEKYAGEHGADGIQEVFFASFRIK
jgi:flagellar basal body-associated protein FliL